MKLQHNSLIYAAIGLLAGIILTIFVLATAINTHNLDFVRLLGIDIECDSYDPQASTSRDN